jgi:hypothetical protein
MVCKPDYGSIKPYGNFGLDIYFEPTINEQII